MPKKLLTVGLVPLLLLIVSCAQRLVAYDHDGRFLEKGFTYYLPKPYLIVGKNVSLGEEAKPPQAPPGSNPEKPPPKKEGAEKKEQAGGAPSGGNQVLSAEKPTEAPAGEGDKYEFRIVYLPDTTDAGTRHVRISQGMGSLETSFALQNGWQFTGLSIKNDAEVDEALKATAELVGAIAEGAATLAPVLLTHEPPQFETPILPKPVGDESAWFLMGYDLTTTPPTRTFCFSDVGKTPCSGAK